MAAFNGAVLLLVAALAATWVLEAILRSPSYTELED